MGDFFSGMQDSRGASLVVAILVVSVALLAMVVIFWLYKGTKSRVTFIRGGKSRQPRLAVLDATAIDTRRRLILIRRDDVEHLLLVGGPTDLVIESAIGAPHAAAALQAPPMAQPLAAARTDQPRPVEPRIAASLKDVAPAEPPPPRNVAPAAPVLPADAARRPADRPAEDAADILDHARGRVLASGPAVTPTPFPPERFAEPAAAEFAKSDTAGAPAVTAGNPFSDDAFAAVLDAELAKDSGTLDVAPARTEVPEPVPVKKEGTLEEEMAKLLSEMTPGRK